MSIMIWWSWYPTTWRGELTVVLVKPERDR